MGIGKKMTKGMIGGGVNISHKSKMTQSAKNQMGFSNGMPGPNVVGRGMAQYIAGENVSIGMRMGKPHGGPKKGKAHKNTPYKLGDLSVDAGSGGMRKYASPSPVEKKDLLVGGQKKLDKKWDGS